VIGAVDDPVLVNALAEQGVSAYFALPIAPSAFIEVVSMLMAHIGGRASGETIAFVGARVGAGCSTLARAVAWRSAELLGLPSAVLDFSRPAMVSLGGGLREPERLDGLLSRLALAGETASVFSAPCTDDDAATPAACRAVITALQRKTRALALDLPHVWPSFAHSSVVGADEVVIVAGPDLESLRNAKPMFDALSASRPRRPAPRLVLSQVGLPGRLEVPIKSFADFIGVEPAVLPFDPRLAGGKGGSALEAADGDLADALIDFSALLVGCESPPNLRTSASKVVRA
jgi:pilus assembly protein CpaE